MVRTAPPPGLFTKLCVSNGAPAAFFRPASLRVGAGAQRRIYAFANCTLEEPRPANDKTTPYFCAFVDLSGDGREEIIVLPDRSGLVWERWLYHVGTGPRRFLLQSCYQNHSYAASNPRLSHKIEWLARYSRLGTGRGHLSRLRSRTALRWKDLPKQPFHSSRAALDR
jgi:hypothetical protein